MSEALAFESRSIACAEGQIAVRCYGDASDPPLLLIHGLALTIEDWSPSFITALVAAGRWVLAIDNRDVGQSSRWADHPAPGPLLAWIMARLPIPRWLKPAIPYAIADMAQDAIAVLDALEIRDCDILGVSMGGMIAQRMALLVPDRIRTLSLIMTSSNGPRLPLPDAAVRKLMAKPPRTRDLDALEAYMQRVRQLIAAPRDDADKVELSQRVTRATSYGYPPQEGSKRQLAAIVSDARRWRQLGSIETSALVIHGDFDPLLPLAHGRDLARRLGNARLLVIPEMAHELLPSNQAAVLAELRTHFEADQARRTMASSAVGLLSVAT